MKGFLSGCEKYPEELLIGRKLVEGNVISCIWKDPLLIDESNLTSQDFVTEDGIFYYALAQHLRKKGFASFDEVTVLSNISDFVEAGFQERGGWNTIQNLIDIINEKNWDTYLDILYRENIILNLHNNGFNLLTPIEEHGKIIIPLNLFRKMPSEAVIDWYDSKISSIGTGYSSKVLEDEEIEFDDEFLQSCFDGAENGVPFDIAGLDINNEEMNCFKFLSKQVSGFMEGTLNILGAYSSVGKSTWWVTILMALIYRGRKCLIISNEQKVKVFKIQFIIWILYKYFRYYNLTKKKMLNGDISVEDKVYLKKAQVYWNENYKSKVKFIGIPDADMSMVKKKVRENVLKYGYDTVLYDTLKIDFEGNSNEQHFISLIKDSRELDKMAKKYNIIMLCSLQLAINTLGKLFLDASVLSMSKQIKEVLENLFLMRTVYAEELDKTSKFYLRPFQRKLIDGLWVEEEYDADPTATWRILFVDKSRNGENSSDNGVAYLLRFDGSHGIFREVAQCRPKHTTIS